MRIKYRRGDVTLDDAQPVRHILVGVSPFLEFDNRDQLFGAVVGTAIAAQRPEVISWMVASMSSGAWLRPYTIKRSLMRPMMNSSPPETKPESPVRSKALRVCPPKG